jgi:DNA-directed RNA polymerase specialized sigma24 family protein
MIVDREFDLDVTFEEQADEQLIASLSAEKLSKHIQSLPQDLIDAATGILIERRTYSDVSQSLGIRQQELVRAVHRAKLIISESQK